MLLLHFGARLIFPKLHLNISHDKWKQSSLHTQRSKFVLVNKYNPGQNMFILEDYSCSWSSAQCHFPSFPLPFTPPSQFISSLFLLHSPPPSPTLSFEAEGDTTGEVTVDSVRSTEVLGFRATSSCKEEGSRKKKERGREGEIKERREEIE